jgi:hypothetical protein
VSGEIGIEGDVEGEGEGESQGEGEGKGEGEGEGVGVQVARWELNVKVGRPVIVKMI